MIYGIELWGTSKNSNLIQSQKFQSITLRVFSNAIWYVKNHTLLHEFNIPTYPHLLLIIITSFMKTT